MRAFWRVQRKNGILWAKMYTDCKSPWYAACRPVNNRKEAQAAFADFVAELRQMGSPH